MGNGGKHTAYPPPQLGYKREAAGKANLDGEQL